VRAVAIQLDVKLSAFGPGSFVASLRGSSQ
jgi:hypothetical protein